ncbi:hypothetical protein K2224_31340 (plasmid) [Streptomyces sp. BHT-5-2]|uniref:hypothetical protein n=1 Tax=unclassified Streptomyces TaxID=2593676 RepID=UPI001C8DBE5B|nr:hypothetical protein [Streptomyces sp. BHT-5-2]QZL07728.1 hypothetical protein K2224_31340 [Streptomyces sp. BHT-5-2]
MNSVVRGGRRLRGRVRAALSLAVGAVMMSAAAAGAADLGMITYTTPKGKAQVLKQPEPGQCYAIAGEGLTSNLSLVRKTAHFYAGRHCAGKPVAELGPGMHKKLKRFGSLRVDAD